MRESRGPAYANRDDSYFSKRRQPKHFVNRRINSIGEERQHHEDENGIDGLDLRRQPFFAEDVPVHFVRLHDPRRKILLPERPEHGCEWNENQEIAERLQVFALKEFLSVVAHPSGWNVDESPASQPEDDGRNEHENAWYPKGDSRPRSLQ